MTKALIYARVSSKEQEDSGYSLPAQEKLLQEYAQKHGFDVVKIFAVSESASGQKQREVFTTMLNLTSKNKINIRYFINFRSMLQYCRTNMLPGYHQNMLPIHQLHLINVHTVQVHNLSLFLYNIP